MKKITTYLRLPKEAVLLDSWLYIFKSMPALALAFIIGTALPQFNLDMISLLLGVMYNLEPVNKMGFKSARDQMITSALGGLITGLLVLAVGYRINALTVALGMGLTIYVSLLVDYRFVSPAALFTSIYMTQLIRLNASGQPDIWLTLLIRLVSLGLGVLVAMAFNVAFSILYYQRLASKRLEFVKRSVLNCLIETRKIYESTNPMAGQSSILAGAFNDIEMVKANLDQLLIEKSKTLSSLKVTELKHDLQRLIALKNMLHLAYDGLYRWEMGESKCGPDGLLILDKIIQGLSAMDYTSKKTGPLIDIEIPFSLLGDFSRSAVNIKWMAMHFQELA